MEFIWVACSAILGLFAFSTAMFWVRIKAPLMLTAWADAAHNRKDYANAERLYSLARNWARRTEPLAFARSTPRGITPLSAVMQAMSIHHFKLGEYKESFEIDEERLTLLEQSGDYAHAAAAASNLAVGYMMQDNIERALALAERCPNILASALKQASKDEASTLDKLQRKLFAAELLTALFSQAWILEVMRKYEEAWLLRVRAVEIAEAEFGDDAFEITPHLNRLGNIALLQSKLDAAEEPLRRALSIRERQGADDVMIASSRKSMGEWYLAKGEIEQARGLIEGAHATAYAMFSSDNPSGAEFELTLGVLRGKEKRYDEAELHMKNSLDCFKHKFGENNPLLLDGLEALHSVYLDAGRVSDMNEIQKRMDVICARCKIDKKGLGCAEPVS